MLRKPASTRSARLATAIILAGLAAGCGEPGTEAARQAPPLAEVAKPPPGVDIDRSTAVGQVIETYQDEDEAIESF